MNPSPWGGLEHGHIAFCEARLDAWIAEPANAWSSFAYVAVGAYLAMRARRTGQSLGWLASSTSVLLGVGSFAFHATGAFAGQFADESSMFLMSAMMLTLALRRVFGWSTGTSLLAFVTLAASAILVLARTHGAGIWIFAAHILSVVVLEVWLGRTADARGERGNYALMRWTILFFAFAFGVWAVDLLRVACDPKNHVFGGHAAWHVLSAIALIAYHRFQASLAIAPRAPSPVPAGAEDPIGSAATQ